MTFYFLTIDKEEYLLEFDSKSQSKIVEMIQEYLNAEPTDPMPGDSKDVESFLKRLQRQNIVRIHSVLIGKISGKKDYIRDAKREDEEPEYCEY